MKQNTYPQFVFFTTCRWSEQIKDSQSKTGSWKRDNKCYAEEGEFQDRLEYYQLLKNSTPWN